jgi:hypothetical protein
MRNRRRLLRHCLFLGLMGACGSPPSPPTPTLPVHTATPTGPPPVISSVIKDKDVPGRYERVDLTVSLNATYDNPFDSQQIALSATFFSPAGRNWEIPGFWDGKSWRLRFTPGEVGDWRYVVRLRDKYGTVDTQHATFSVTDSDHHGWLQVASWHNSSLSSRYLVYHDGTPCYGVGHCEAFTLDDAGWDADNELRTLSRMRENGENLVVWWPHYNFTFFRNGPTDFDRIDMELIDTYLASAERLGITVVYTIWDHNLLRGEGHPWGGGSWQQNGFRHITPNAADFFTDEESWKAQENFYRYLIARWGYSPSIIWQTVSELNGTSAGANQDAWHAKINDYFVRNDPYRHPTTASLSGDQDWPAGFTVTDIPQVHLYEAQKDPAAMGDSVARWTKRMWDVAPRPNVVGEFGTTNRSLDERLLHNGIWSALTSGAAITPLRWSDRGSWGPTSAKLMIQLKHFSAFVADIPFPSLDLQPAHPAVTGENLFVQGLASSTYALIWVQDRQQDGARSDIVLTLPGLDDGAYTARPFNTWTGEELPTIPATVQGRTLTVAIPEFERDIALKVVASGR